MSENPEGNNMHIQLDVLLLKKHFQNVRLHKLNYEIVEKTLYSFLNCAYLYSVKGSVVSESVEEGESYTSDSALGTLELITHGVTFHQRAHEDAR